MDRKLEASEVAQALGLSADSVGRYARERRIPFDVTPGGHRRYNLDEVRQALRPGANGGSELFSVPAATARRRATRSVRTAAAPAAVSSADASNGRGKRSEAVAKLLAGARSVQFSTRH